MSAASTTWPRPVRSQATQRSEHALEGEHAGQRVAQRQCDPRRRLVGVAVEVTQPAHPLGDRRIARTLGERTGLAVARHPREHELGVDRGELVVPEAPALQRPGTEALDDHVGLPDQVEHQLATAVDPQVEGDAALVARVHRPEELVAAAGLAPVAQGVVTVGRLDLDHVGAHVGEQPPGVRPGDESAELDDAEAVERTGGEAGRSNGHRQNIIWTVFSSVYDSMPAARARDRGRCRRVRPREWSCPGCRTR